MMRFLLMLAMLSPTIAAASFVLGLVWVLWAVLL